MLRSRAIDHCRESHAFAQVSVQGSFPPLRCTNPPRAHAWRGCVCVYVYAETTHEGENAEDSSWEEVEEIVFQDWRIFILVFILKVLSMRNNFFHEGNFLKYNFWEILVLLKFFGIQENFMCLCENEDF